MKAEIHPDYIECHVTCGCGNKFETRATVAKLTVEICSSCHPFYTGKQKFVDAAGRVEKFQQRFAWKDDSAGGVLSGAAKVRDEERQRIQVDEDTKRRKRVEKQKKTDERRKKILEDKKAKYAEAEAAKKAEEAASTATEAAAAEPAGESAAAES